MSGESGGRPGDLSTVSLTHCGNGGGPSVRGSRSPSASSKKSHRLPPLPTNVSVSGHLGRVSNGWLAGSAGAMEALAGPGGAGGATSGLTRDENWSLIQRTVLGMFQKPQQYQALRMEPLNVAVGELERTYSVQAILERCMFVICKGMIILRERLRDLDGSEFIMAMSELWGTFYSDSLAMLMSAFSARHSKVFPHIRKLALTAFRDYVVLSSAVRQKLEDYLQLTTAMLTKVENEDDEAVGPPAAIMPPLMTQMLLVLQSCGNHDRSEREIQRLLSRLQPCLVQADASDSPLPSSRHVHSVESVRSVQSMQSMPSVLGDDMDQSQV